MENSRNRVYYSEVHGEFIYQIQFFIGILVLWQIAKNCQNCDQIPIMPDFCYDKSYVGLRN
jgi:hypothetical protein